MDLRGPTSSEMKRSVDSASLPVQPLSTVVCTEGLTLTHVHGW